MAKKKPSPPPDEQEAQPEAQPEQEPSQGEQKKVTKSQMIWSVPEFMVLSSTEIAEAVKKEYGDHVKVAAAEVSNAKRKWREQQGMAEPKPSRPRTPARPQQQPQQQPEAPAEAKVNLPQAIAAAVNQDGVAAVKSILETALALVEQIKGGK